MSKSALLTVAVWAAITASSTGASSEELVTIGVTKSGLVLVDKDSLASAGTTSSILEYEVNPVGDDATGDRLPYVLRLVEIDCAQSRHRDTRVKYVRSDGLLLGERKGAADWDMGIPGSPSAKIAKMVCDDRFDATASLKGQSLNEVIAAYRRIVSAGKQ